MAFSASGPCPWPSEMAFSFFAKPSLSAKRISSLMGSAPGVSTKISGVSQFESR